MKRALVLLVVVACSQTKTNDLPPEAWGVADYASAGLAVDKAWTAAEHLEAARVLARVTAGHRERLPRFRGAKSGAVFVKLVAPLSDDASAPLAQRFGEHVQRYEATNAIAKLYTENALAAPTREWIEIYGALLREATLLARDAEPFLASLGPDDPKREVRLRGLDKMKLGFGSMLLGGLLTAGDTRVPEADRVAVVEGVTTAIPVLYPQATPETQQSVRDQLAKLMSGLPAGKLRDAVGAAHQAIPR